MSSRQDYYMTGLRKEGEDRSEKLNALMILKNKIQKDRIQLGERSDLGLMHILEKKIDEILFKMRDLDRKIESIRRERIHEFIEMERFSKKIEEEESPRTRKVKAMIKSLLEEHGKLSASQLSKMIKLSRTRCSEYLKEMERQGIVEGTTIRRQRFYHLKKQ